jgi:hypothetical protein
MLAPLDSGGSLCGSLLDDVEPTRRDSFDWPPLGLSHGRPDNRDEAGERPHEQMGTEPDPAGLLFGAHVDRRNRRRFGERRFDHVPPS